MFTGVIRAFGPGTVKAKHRTGARQRAGRRCPQRAGVRGQPVCGFSVGCRPWPTTVSTFACGARRARSATPYQSRRVLGPAPRAPGHLGGKWVSLSPRERAGVRGKGVANLPCGVISQARFPSPFIPLPRGEGKAVFRVGRRRVPFGVLAHRFQDPASGPAKAPPPHKSACHNGRTRIHTA